MGAARKLDSFGLASSEQLNEMVSGNLGKEELFRINDKKKDIWEKVRNAVEFNSQEKEAIKETLQSGLKDSSIEEINSFASNIERRRNGISRMINAYFGQLESNQKYFAQREGYNAVDLYKKEFLQLDEEGKQQWLDKLHEEIQERVQLHEELSQYVSPDQLSRMRRSELRRMQQYVRECDRVLHQHRQLFSADEIQSIKTQIADCTTHRDQMKLLTEVVGQLDQRKWYMGVYKRLPEKYRNIWGNISTMSLQERTERYELLVVRIEQDYERTLFNHPDRKHIGAKDRAAALAYVRSDTTSGGDKFRALKNLNKQIQYQKKEVSDPFEETLSVLEEHLSPREIKKIKDTFYDAPSFEARKALAEEVKMRLVEAQHESNEAKELTSEYTDRLDADLSNGIIGKKTHKEALKRWKKKTLDEMHATMAIYGKDRERRIKVLQEFEKLPQEIQDKNSDFFELTHTDRKVRLESLTKGDQSQTKNKKEKTSNQNKKKETPETASEEQETSDDQKIHELSILAATATRNQNYQQARQYYERILAINPNDEVALINLNYIESKLPQTEEEGTTTYKEGKKLSSSDQNKVKEIVRAAAETKTIRTSRRRLTASGSTVKEAKKSEAKHGSHKIASKTKGLSEKDKVVNEQLQEHTGGSYILQGDEAKKVMWIHEKGLRDKNNPDREAKIEQQIKKDIVQSGDNKPYDAIQFYNDSGNVSNASVAEKELEKRDQEIRNAIVKTSEKYLDNDAEVEAARKVADNMNLEVELRAA